MPLAEGFLLHQRYRIEKTIATGGMGAVYRAQDETLNIAVAVKENFFTTEEFSRQFRREATILASLRHPNLPRVTDHFVIPGQGQYLVMDFIAGTDLREMLANNGPQPETDVLRIGLITCDALDYLHSRNPAIVHRDVKPGNLKICPDGQVFLVDFGLAKIAHGDATATGAQALTPGYAPPEQYGQGTEPRSDLYALGATLYAALTGKIPEDGLSRAMGSAELTPIRKHNPAVSEATARAIERAMEIRPADRYASATAFKEALGKVAQGKGLVAPAGDNRPSQVVSAHVESASPPAPRPAPVGQENQPEVKNITQRKPPLGVPQPAVKHGFPFIPVLGIGGIIVLAGVAVMLFSSGLFGRLFAPAPTSSPTLTLTLAPTTPHVLPTATVAKAEVALTPTITATVKPAETTQAPTATPAPAASPTSDASGFTRIAATPLGGSAGQIAYSSEQDGSIQVWVMNTDGSGAQQVTHLADGACQPDWSPDGQRLVFISPCSGKKEDYPGASLFLINADGSGLVPLVSMPGGDFDPAWSPDGMQIAFTSLRDTITHVYLYNLAENSAKRLSRPVNHERRPAWSRDGTRIAFESTRLGLPQIWTVDPAGKDFQEFSLLEGAYDSWPAWSPEGPDGRVILFSHSSQGQLLARQFGDRTAQQFQVTDQFTKIQVSRFSPDGMWIVFDTQQDGNMEIYRMSQNGGMVTRLTENPGADFSPSWRPAAKP